MVRATAVASVTLSVFMVVRAIESVAVAVTAMLWTLRNAVPTEAVHVPVALSVL